MLCRHAHLVVSAWPCLCVPPPDLSCAVATSACPEVRQHLFGPERSAQPGKEPGNLFHRCYCWQQKPLRLHVQPFKTVVHPRALSHAQGLQRLVRTVITASLRPHSHQSVVVGAQTHLLCPAGSNKNYPNPPGWGLSFHLNGFETPVVRVTRGRSYRFTIMAGETHPFYITDTIIGGGARIWGEGHGKTLW